MSQEFPTPLTYAELKSFIDENFKLTTEISIPKQTDPLVELFQRNADEFPFVADHKEHFTYTPITSLLNTEQEQKAALLSLLQLHAKHLTIVSPSPNKTRLQDVLTKREFPAELPQIYHFFCGKIFLKAYTHKLEPIIDADNNSDRLQALKRRSRALEEQKVATAQKKAAKAAASAAESSNANDDDLVLLDDNGLPINSNKLATATDTDNSTQEPIGNGKTYSVFIGNFPFNAKESQIMEFFAETCAVNQVNLLRHDSTKQPLGCGFIICPTHHDARKALTRDQEEFLGRPINVQEPRTIEKIKKRQEERYLKQQAQFHEQE